MSGGEPTGAAVIGPAARAVDAALARMDGEIDWLGRLTPLNLDAVWDGFRSSGFSTLPELVYDDGLPELDDMRRALFDLPVHEIGNGLVESLLIEKQRELDRQLELVRLRGGEGFVLASIDLFGAVSASLVDEAERVLDAVPHVPPEDSTADASDFVVAARREVQHYRERAPSLDADVIVDSTPGTHVLVSAGHLHVASDYRLPPSRILPLLHHEVGTHVLTRHNGRQQPLRTLEVGLADYDALQEGLAALAEYLCGYLPASRLRTLAARVIAAEMAIRHEPPASIYAAMVERCLLDEELAFSTTVRALRGGGMTKDALYLAGLIDLLAHLARDGDFERLFLGKFALKHEPILAELLERGVLVPPALLPRYLDDEGARQRLARVRSIDLAQLWQEAPAP